MQIVGYFEENDKSNYVVGLDKRKVDDIIKFLKPFKEETDLLQQQKVPTLQIPLLTYYWLKNHCAIDTADSRMVRLLEIRGSRFLDEKLFPSLTMRHKIATFLQPSYRKLTMLTDEERQEVSDFC